MPEEIVIADAGKIQFRLSAVILIRDVEGKHLVSLSNGIEFSLTTNEAHQLMTQMADHYPTINLS